MSCKSLLDTEFERDGHFKESAVAGLSAPSPLPEVMLNRTALYDSLACYGPLSSSVKAVLLEHKKALANLPPPQNTTLSVLRLSAHKAPFEEQSPNIHQIFALSLKRLSGLNVSRSSTSPGAAADTECDPGSQ